MIEVDVITADNIRKPDYEGSYTVIEDRGDTMLIKVSEANEVETLKEQLADVWELLLFGGFDDV